MNEVLVFGFNHLAWRRNMAGCNDEGCRSAVLAFYAARTNFRTKKAAHDTECAELDAASSRLVAFLKGLAAALGAYIAAAVSVAIGSLASGAGVAAALTALSGTLTALAATLQSIPFIGQALGVIVVAAIATLATLTALYFKNLYEEAQTRSACDAAHVAAITAHGAALVACPIGEGCVPDFNEGCNCP